MKKMGSFLKRVLSLVLSLMMLLGDMGWAFAETVSEPTLPLAVELGLDDLFDYNGQEITTSTQMTYVGTTDYVYSGGAYQTLPDYVMYYWVDIQVGKADNGYIHALKADLNTGFPLSGNATAQLYYGTTAAERNGMTNQPTGVTVTATGSAGDTKVTLLADSGEANGSENYNLHPGYYRFLVGLPMSDDQVQSMLANNTAVTNTVGNVEANHVASNNQNVVADTVSFNPTVTKTAKQVQSGWSNYIRWELHYTSGIKLHKTIVSDTINSGTFLEYSQEVNGEKLQAYDHGYLIRGNETFTNNHQTITFDVTGAHEGGNNAAPELRYLYTTDLKLVYFSTLEMIGGQWWNIQSPANVASSYTVTPNGITGTEISNTVNGQGNPAKAVTVKIQRVTDGGEPVPVQIQGQNTHLFAVMGNDDLSSVTSNYRLTMNNGTADVVIVYQAGQNKLYITTDQSGATADNSYSDGDVMPINANNDQSGTNDPMDQFTVEVQDNGGNATVTLTNYIVTKPITFKIESYDEGTGAYSAVKPYNENNVNLYAVYLDAEGNALSNVVHAEPTGQTGVYTAKLEMPAGAQGTLNLLTLKYQKSYKPQYVAEDYNNYYQGKLQENTVYIPVLKAEENNSPKSMEEFFALNVVENSDGSALFHLTNSRSSALQGLVDAYNGGELEVNEETGAFKDYDGGKYFNASSPIGIAGSFHIVAFEEAHLNAHTNGNILANKLYARNNFGTNGLPFELHYIVDYVQVHSTSSSSKDHILALGAGNKLNVTENGTALSVGVNGTRIDTPDNVIIDKDPNKPFINLDSVESEVKSLSSTLASNSENVGISEEVGPNWMELHLTSTSGAGYYNMSASQLNNLGNRNMRMCFTDQNAGSIVINVDCSGVSTINMPSEARVNINGVDQATSEVTSFANGKVIWNFHNLSRGTVINVNQTTGMILAPGAEVHLKSNVNGTIVADWIYVEAESHRTDFTGTTTPASSAFSAVKQVNGKTPTGDEKFWFVLEELNADGKTWDEVRRAQNNGSKVDFGNITYTEAGLHTYRIRELDVDVPAGYTISTETYYMQVEVYASTALGNTALGKKYTFWKENQSLPSNDSFVFNNTKDTVDLVLIKKDADHADAFLPGAVFQLTGPNGYNQTVTTNSQGQASFSDMAPGQYTLTELTAPVGYEMPSPNSWTFTRNDDGTYTIGTLENASISDKEMTVTNKREKKIDIHGSKTWNDNNNQYNNRPQSIVISLMKDGTLIDSRIVTEADNWSWSFTGLDGEDENGNLINYTIEEIAVPGYVSTVVGYDVTNSTETVRLNGEKTWEGDGECSELTRPQIVTIRVWDGQTEVATAQSKSNTVGHWFWSVDGLPKYKNGQEVTYTITEDAVPGYTTTINGMNVVNTLVTTTVSGTKTWDDQDNKYNLRPQYLTIKLNKTVNGVTTEGVKTLNVHPDANGQWSWSFTGLPTKERIEGTFYDVTYSIDEVAVNGYTSVVNGYDITNTLKTTSLSGSKTWADEENKYQTRPDSITVNLLRNGTKVDSVVATKDNDYAWSFTNLPVEDLEGKAYTYTFEEALVNGYTPTYDTASNVINNTLITTDLRGTKTWTDEEDKYGLRPEQVTINVLRDGSVVATTTATKAGNWAWEVTGLPVYDKTTGNTISYTVAEEPVIGYVPYISGTAIDNHLETVTLNGNKTWVDDDNAHGTRPVSIEVKAMNGETVVKTVTVKPVNGDWSWTITDLPKYDAAGNEVTYTVVETPVMGYTTDAIVYNEGTQTFDLTNRLITTELSVAKVWNDKNNQEGKRLPTIEVQLTAGGAAKGATVTLDDANGWAYTWTGLPKLDAQGNEIVYTVDEIVVPEGYVKTVTSTGTSYTITNTYVFDTAAALKAKKVLTGAPLTAGQFRFELKDQSGNLLETVTNDGNGNVYFSAIEFDQAGTYTYTINEVIGTAGGITYDTAIYTATVTVTQNDETKQLSTAVAYEGLTAGDAVPTFRNTYTNTETTATIPVEKVLKAGQTGLQLPDITKAFTFTLEAITEGAPMPATTSITNDGKPMSFGDITFTAPGTYQYVVKESGTVDGVTNDGQKNVTITVADNGDGSLTATVTSDTGSTVVFTNTYNVGETSAQIPVEKMLKVPAGLEGPDSIKGAYTFTLEAVNGAPMPAEGENIIQNPEDKGGTASFGVIKFTKPGTYRYTVTETGSVPGVTNDQTATKNVTISVTDDGKGKLTASVIGNGGAKVTFTNEYQVADATAVIPVEKTLAAAQTGLNLPDITGQFTFTLEGKTGKEPMPAENTTLTNDGSAMQFGAITFTTAGTYQYVVKESGTVAGVTNDGEKNVTITVTDQKDGTLKATVACGTSSIVGFTNVYDVEHTSAQIPVEKSLEIPAGLTGPGDITGRFSFTLTPEKEGQPMPQGGLYTINNPTAKGGTAVFGAIQFTAPGVYKYTVTETGTVAGVVNDAVSVKNVTITVTDDGLGNLSAKVEVGDEKADKVTFTNKYEGKPTSISIPVDKELIGTVKGLTLPDINGKFTFKIAGSNGAPLPAVTSQVYNGSILTFGEITFTTAGTFTYTFSEEGKVPGVTNDTALKQVTVTVADDGKGNLYIENNSLAQGEKVLFTNEYKTGEVDAAISAEKIFQVAAGQKGLDVTGLFTFTLEAVTENAPMPADQVFSKTNPDADGGVVTFDKMTFTVPGVYIYKVTESGNVPGVTNDAENSKTVTITVTDHSDGTMSVTNTASAANPVTFTNSYKADSVEISLPVEKMLSHVAGLNAPSILNAFTFTLTAKDGTPMPKVTELTNPDVDGGSMSFGPISYDKVGTYEYTITESGTVAGVTNDSAKTLTVTVTDDGTGKLTATLSDPAGVTFDNQYTVTETTAQIPVEKVLEIATGKTGPGDITGKFTFTLAAVTAGAPMPAEAERVITNPAADGGIASFGVMTYTLPGTYEYTVTESATVPGITNDATSIKTVYVVVTDDGQGKLSAKVEVGTEKADKVTFTNRYDAKPTSWSIPVEKVLDKGGLTNNLDITGKYIFTITGSNPLPATTQLTNDAGVALVFGPMAYDTVGTYTYTISESGTVAGVQNDSAKTVSVTVADDGQGNLYIASSDLAQGESVVFTNRYTVGEAQISLSMEKQLVVPAGLKGTDITGKFTYTLAGVGKVPMPEDGVLQKTNPAKDGGTVTFGTIKYTVPGVYEYTITESGEVDGVVNDAQATKTITVTVADNGDGTMTATASTDTNPVVFTNTYTVKETTLSMPVEKTLAFDAGLNAPDIDGKFTFTLTSDDANAPMPAVTTLTYTEDGDGKPVAMAFGPIAYTSEGKWTYTITESGSVAGVTNAAAQTITVTVVDNGDGTLTATSDVAGNKLSFVNTYDVGSTTAQVPVEKMLNVPAGLTGPADITEQFTFTISRHEDNALAPLPDVTSLKNPAANGGQMTFGDITYTEPGTYKYWITESGTVNGIVNDAKASKLVTVTVVDNGDGSLTATVDTETGATLTFTNDYTVKETTVSFPAKKALTVPQGLAAASIKNAFTFTLAAKDGAPLPQDLSFVNPDDNGGVVTFGPITYTMPGTYTYMVTETGNVPGIINDAQATKTVQVTVVDNGDGTLTATATSTDLAPLTFTNSYDVDDVKASIPVLKVLDVLGGDNPANIKGLFSFELKAVTAGAPMPAVTKQVNPDVNGGTVTFGEISFTMPGTYEYTITETGSVPGVTNDAQATKNVTITVADNGAGKLVATVSATADAPVTFTNTYDVDDTTAQIPVEKLLNVPADLTGPADITGLFTFTLADKTGSEPMPTVAELTNPDVAGGQMTFGDITFTAPGIYEYTVTESGNVPGITNDAQATKTVYVEVMDNGDGTLTATVDTQTGATLTFTNDYTVKETTASFPIEKKVVATDGLTAPDITGLFSFTLTAADGVPVPGTVRYTNPDADGGKVTFGPITYTVPGTYTYTITEAVADGKTAGGFSLAGAQTVTVTVTDNGDGTLTATPTSTDDKTLAFTNTYSVGKATVSIPVEKVLEVPANLKGTDITGKFTFTLTGVTGTEPMPATTSYQNPDADGGLVTFGTMTYDKPGTYQYIITESGSADGVANDPVAAKTATVTVVDNGDGTLTATCDATDLAPLTFTNRYEVKPTQVSFPAKKVLEKADGLTAPDITGQFTFTLTGATGTEPMPAVAEYTNPAADGGTVTFGQIEYTVPGTYEYVITETGTVAGITNDSTAARNVTVTVVDNGDGTLTATASATDANPVTFTNRYKVKEVKASFPVKKELVAATGLTAPDITGAFTFTLAGKTGSEPMPAVAEYTNPAKDGGIATFGEIEYTMPGTYEYTVTETGTVAGIINDATATKTVTVTVTDNGDGTLTATVDSTALAPLTFTNEYKVGETEISIPVEKVLEKADGLTPADITGKFTFTLAGKTGTEPMPAVTEYTNPTAVGGSVTFGSIQYTVPGTYEYTVTETGTVPGIVNDAQATKTVTVTVVDNSDGTLTATATATDLAPITFTNRYEVKSTTASFPVQKILAVAAGDTAPDITGAFTFELAAINGAPMPDTIRYTTPAADGGTVTFGDMTYTKPGTYEYTVTETGSVAGIINDATATKTVTVEVVDNGDGTLTATASATAAAPLTFTNTNDAVDISVAKVWDDDNNRDALRPASIQVQLMADGAALGAPVTLDDSNGWATSWNQLPRYTDETGTTAIAYTVEEIVDDATKAAYTITVNPVFDADGNGNVTITNTHAPEVIDITGSKRWDDLANIYLKRPTSVTIRLYADGVEIDSKVVTEADNWSWTFANLPKYQTGAVGKQITYTISEDIVTGYITTIDEYNVLNTLNLVQFIKQDQQTGKALAGAGFALYEGDVSTGGAGGIVETWTSDGTPKVLAGLKVGQTYTIVETFTPSGFITMNPFVFTVELSDTPTTYRTFTAGNCHIYRFRKLDTDTNGLVLGATLAVLDNKGAVIEKWVTSSSNDGWFEIADDRLMPGQTYTLAELIVPFGYEYAQPIPFAVDPDTGMLIVNGRKTNSAQIVMYDDKTPEVTPTPEPTTTTFSVTKRWEDKENVLGLRPTSITVHLYRKASTEADFPTVPYMTVNIMSNGKDVWNFTFEDLPRRNADGVLYEYTTREEVVDGYVVTYLNGGKTIINAIPEEDYPPTPTPTLPYVTPTPTPVPKIPRGVQFVDGEWVYIDEYGVPLGGVPQTGDETNFVLWGMAIGLPILVAALAAVEIRRRKKLLATGTQDEEEE